MRGKDFNTGLRGVLFEAQHYERMGSAVWLYAWLVLRQTHQTGSTGWVLGGAPVSYKEIEAETGFNARTLERWMRILRRHGYVETEAAMGGLIVRITKAKKHARSARDFAKSGTQTLRRAADEIRKLADGPREFAEGSPHNCVANQRNSTEDTQLAPAIRSSSVEESLGEYIGEIPNHKPKHFEGRNSGRSGIQNEKQIQFQTLNSSRSGESQNQGPTHPPHLTRDPFAGPGRTPRVRVQPPQKPWIARDEVRLQLELLRAEREDAVRRELHVGRGPEISGAAQRVAPEIPEVKR